MSFTNTPLFGGAITVDLPNTFRDVSTIRQVPDHQEVFLDANGYSSIVFDILERVDQSDEEALMVHVADIVSGTGDQTRVIKQSTGTLGPHPLPWIHFLQIPPTSSTSTDTTVSQTTSAPKRKTPDFTSIHLLLLRLAQQTTDIVITVNVPHYPGEYAKQGLQNDAGEVMETQNMKDAEVVVDKIRGSFEVKDWGLFGEVEERKDGQ